MLNIILLMLLSVRCIKNVCESKAYNKGINENLIEFFRNGDKNRVIDLLNRNFDVNFKNMDNKTAIHYSVTYGWKNITKDLLEKGADINIKDIQGYSPLFYAILFGHSKIIKLLIQNGADVNFKDSRGNSLLISSIMKNNQRLAKLLIKSGANVNDKNDDMKTALFYAIQEKYLEITRMLLIKGAEFDLKQKEKIEEIIRERYDINFIDEGGNTSLIIAAYKGELEMVKILLERGANVNSKNINGLSSLMIASGQGYKKIVQILIDKGANINDKDSKNFSALIRVLNNNKLDSKLKEVTKILIEKGINFNIEKDLQDSILFYSSKHGNLEIMELLSKKGIDIASYGTKALINTLTIGDFYISNFLIEKGAKIDFKDFKSWNLLINNLNNSKFNPKIMELIKILIEREANLNNASKIGSLILPYAAKNGDLEFLEMLKRKGADIANYGEEALINASIKGHCSIIKFLIENGLRVGNEDGIEALTNASKYGRKDVVRLLLKNTVNINGKDVLANSAIINASIGVNSNPKNYNLEVVSLLIEEGANINDKDTNDDSPLMKASYFGHIEIVKLLLERGAIINHRNRQGKSSLIYASQMGYLEIVKLLISKGADIYLKDNNQISPLIYLSKKLRGCKKKEDKEKYIAIAYKIIRKMSEDYIQLFISLNRQLGEAQEIKDHVNSYINLLYFLQILPKELFERILRHF